MFNLRFEDGKIIFDLTLFLLNLILKVVDIFLLIPEQEYQILGKDIALIIIQECQLGCGALDRNPGLGNVIGHLLSLVVGFSRAVVVREFGETAVGLDPLATVTDVG